MGDIKHYSKKLAEAQDHVLLHVFKNPQDETQVLVSIYADSDQDEPFPDALKSMPIPFKKAMLMCQQIAEENGVKLILVKNDANA